MRIMVYSILSKLRSIIWLMIPYLVCGALLLLSWLCFVGALINSVTATETYYNNNDLTVIGILYYVSSDSGTPVTRLDNGMPQKLYFNAESERALVRDPYLSNVSASSANGYIYGYDYEIKIDYGGRLGVYQPHVSNNNYTRDGWAYYDVLVEDIATPLLWRTDNSTRIITMIISGVALIAVYTMIRRLRRD